MTGHIFVISAPSGTGKTTVIRRVIEDVPNLKLSVSCTTRHPRLGEKEGVDYYFISEGEFKSRIERGRFVEWAEYSGSFYGTPKDSIDKVLPDTDVLLDIETEGAAKVKKKYPEAVLIFLVPPSFDELARRLQGRGTNTDEDMVRRIETARQEMSRRHEYDYQVVNENLDEACQEVIEIINYYRG